MKNIFKMTAIATSIMASSVAFAAVVDSGESVVSVDVPNALEMTGLDDVDLGEYDGDTMTGTENFAVCQNFGAGFQVTVDATPLTNGTDVIAMTAEAEQIADMQPISACDGTPANNAQFDIEIAATAIDAASAGSYSSTVTLTVSEAIAPELP